MKNTPHSSQLASQKEDRWVVLSRKARQMAITLGIAGFALCALFIFLFVGWPQISDKVGVKGAPMNQQGWGVYGNAKPLGEHHLVDLNPRGCYGEYISRSEVERHDRELAFTLYGTLDPVRESSPRVAGAEDLPQMEMEDEPAYLMEEETEWYHGSPGPNTDCTLTVPEVTEEAEEPLTFIEYGTLEKEPAPINLNEVTSNIGYPELLDNAGIYGKVIFRIEVDEEGGYVKHEVIRSPHPELSQLIEKELPNLRFTPAILQGRPVRSTVTIPFLFCPTH